VRAHTGVMTALASGGGARAIEGGSAVLLGMGERRV